MEEDSKTDRLGKWLDAAFVAMIAVSMLELAYALLKSSEN